MINTVFSLQSVEGNLEFHIMLTLGKKTKMVLLEGVGRVLLCLELYKTFKSYISMNQICYHSLLTYSYV